MKNLIKENVVDFNTRLLNNSNVEKFAHIIRVSDEVKNKVFSVIYIENDTEKSPVNKSDESQTNILKTKEKFIECSEHRVAIRVNENMPFIGNEEQQNYLENVLKTETETGICKLIREKIHELANESYRKSFNWFQSILYTVLNWFGIVYIKKTRVKSVNDLVAKLFKRIKNIEQKSITPSYPYIICSARVVNFLTTSKDFVYGKDSIKRINAASIFYMGNIRGIEVYIDPLMSFRDNEIYISTFDKNDENLLSSPKICLLFRDDQTKFNKTVNTIHNLWNDKNTESYNLVLTIMLSVFTVGDNPSERFDKIVVKLPKQI